MAGLGTIMNGGLGERRSRQADDWYPTPPEVTHALLRMWRPRGRIVVEPACGDGAMARVIEGYGYRVIASDLVDRGYGRGGIDFLTVTSVPRDAALITNPPFDDDLPERFIRHAVAIGVVEMAMLLKATFWSAACRLPLWHQHQPKIEAMLTWRVDFLDLGNPAMDCVWCVWYPGDEPCRKELLERPLI
jgi:hypothetical protein